MVDVSKVTLGEMGLFGELKQEIERLTTEHGVLKAAIDEALSGYDIDCYCCDPSACCDRIGGLMAVVSDKLTENPVISPGNPVDDKHNPQCNSEVSSLSEVSAATDGHRICPSCGMHSDDQLTRHEVGCTAADDSQWRIRDNEGKVWVIPKSECVADEPDKSVCKEGGECWCDKAAMGIGPAPVDPDQ